MDRRRFLAGLAGGAATAAAAGCLGPPRSGAYPIDRNVDGLELPVPREEMVKAAVTDGIPAITDPVFAEDWSGLSVTVRDPRVGTYETEPRLSPGSRVIGVERGGEARAYPLSVLAYHEVVNDDFGGPLLVTFCPLCGSGVTVERRVWGQETVFGVSGYLWRQDLVMYDRRSDSLWSQIEATAIRGPATGQQLRFVPSAMTTLGEWRESHPDTRVLVPPPRSDTVVGETAFDYGRDPYANYRTSEGIGVSLREFEDDRLHPKTVVVGVSHGDRARAYPVDAVRAAGVVNDSVGDLPVVVAAAGDAGGEGGGPGDAGGRAEPATLDGTLVAYVRRVDWETLTFERDGPRHLRAGGSRWGIATGRAVDGPHEGTRLDQANDVSPMFWFAWLGFQPETTVYTG